MITLVYPASSILGGLTPRTFFNLNLAIDITILKLIKTEIEGGQLAIRTSPSL
jgi:hypothetical protein